MSKKRVFLLMLSFHSLVRGADKPSNAKKIVTKECEKDCQKAFEAIPKGSNNAEVWKLYQKCLEACNLSNLKYQKNK